MCPIILWQSQFKTQGIKLIPDSPAEQALMYQRMMEGLALTDKLSKICTHPHTNTNTDKTTELNHSQERYYHDPS